jgi:hypothetical protein
MKLPIHKVLSDLLAIAGIPLGEGVTADNFLQRLYVALISNPGSECARRRKRLANVPAPQVPPRQSNAGSVAAASGNTAGQRAVAPPPAPPRRRHSKIPECDRSPPGVVYPPDHPWGPRERSLAARGLAASLDAPDAMEEMQEQVIREDGENPKRLATDSED